MKNIGGLMRQIATWTLYALTGLLPLFFLPITSEFFDTNKQLLVFAAAVILGICFIGYSISKRILRLTLSPVELPVLGVLLALLLSTFIGTPYSYEVFLGRGLFLICLTLLFILGTTLGRAKDNENFVYVVSGSAILLSIVSFLQNVGYGPTRLLNLIPGFNIPNNALFNVAGSTLIAIMFLIPVLIMNLVELFARADVRKKSVHGIVSAIVVIGILINGYYMLNGKVAQPVFLPFQSSWSIAIDTLKSPRSFLFGVGPESYEVAFTQFRPASLNLTPYWTVRFPTARIEPLQILTTMGVVGLAAWGFLALVTFYLAMPLTQENRAASVLALSLLGIQLFFPGNYVVTGLFFLTLVFLVLVRKSRRDSRISDVLLQLSAVKVVTPETMERAEKPASGILAYIVCAVLGVGILYGVYFVGNAYAAEVMFFQSLQALQANDAGRAFTLQQQVVANNPNSDRYHRAFSSTNFLIAQAISQNTSATQDQKAQITPLIQNAVQQALTAKDIDQRKVENWENLAQIYQSLIGSVQGADQYTIAALVRTIQTDPTNPTQRFALANVYSSVQNYDQAILLFQQTIELKPDWANAYFNLANAYQQKGEYDLAMAALQQTQQYVTANSADSNTLNQQIAAVQKLIDAQKSKTTAATGTNGSANKTGTGATGTNDSAANSPLSQEQIRLPQNLGLPEATPPASVPSTPEVSPTPAASPNASANPSASPKPSGSAKPKASPSATP
jgi:tetratricopeptide (TPR) repeat protein